MPSIDLSSVPYSGASTLKCQRNIVERSSVARLLRSFSGCLMKRIRESNGGQDVSHPCKVLLRKDWQKGWGNDLRSTRVVGETILGLYTDVAAVAC